MKKYFLVIVIIVLVVCGVYSQNSGARYGEILELYGIVELKPAGSSSFVRANAGDGIALNTIISTGFRSAAVIAVGNSIITLQPLSQLSFSENLIINLQTGRIKIAADESAGTPAIFTVQSPGTDSIVCGTNFEFNTINMKVEKGKASFSGVSGPAVIVHEGREDALGADKKPAGSSSASCSLPSSPGGIRGSSSGSGGSAAGGGGGGATGGGGSCCD